RVPSTWTAAACPCSADEERAGPSSSSTSESITGTCRPAAVPLSVGATRAPFVLSVCGLGVVISGPRCAAATWSPSGTFRRGGSRVGAVSAGGRMAAASHESGDHLLGLVGEGLLGAGEVLVPRGRVPDLHP